MAKLRAARVGRHLLTIAVGIAVVGGAALPAAAATAQVVIDGVTYEVNDRAPQEGAAVVAYDASFGPSVVISASVEIAGQTFPVTEIGAQAFNSCHLTDVEIPESVTRIEAAAFLDNQLRSVVLPSGLEYLGAYAFNENYLEQVEVPGTLRTIGYEAFAQNYLTSLVINEGVVLIDYYAFANNQLTSVTFPASIDVIQDLAFKENDTLTDVWFVGNAPQSDSFASNGIQSYFGFPADVVIHVDAHAQGFYAPIWRGYTTEVTGEGAYTPPELTIDQWSALNAGSEPLAVENGTLSLEGRLAVFTPDDGVGAQPGNGWEWYSNPLRLVFSAANLTGGGLSLIGRILVVCASALLLLAIYSVMPRRNRKVGESRG